MSDTKNDGGPAFPALDPRKYDAAGELLPRGMSLRDYFAGKAMQSLILAAAQGHLKAKDGRRVGPSDYAGAAYENADAMLAERSK